MILRNGFEQSGTDNVLINFLKFLNFRKRVHNRQTFGHQVHKCPRPSPLKIFKELGWIFLLPVKINQELIDIRLSDAEAGAGTVTGEGSRSLFQCQLGCTV